MLMTFFHTFEWIYCIGCIYGRRRTISECFYLVIKITFNNNIISSDGKRGLSSWSSGGPRQQGRLRQRGPAQCGVRACAPARHPRAHATTRQGQATGAGTSLDLISVDEVSDSNRYKDGEYIEWNDRLKKSIFHHQKSQLWGRKSRFRRPVYFSHESVIRDANSYI